MDRKKDLSGEFKKLREGRVKGGSIRSIEVKIDELEIKAGKKEEKR